MQKKIFVQLNLDRFRPDGGKKKETLSAHLQKLGLPKNILEGISSKIQSLGLTEIWIEVRPTKGTGRQKFVSISNPEVRLTEAQVKKIKIAI
ncbi:MAG: hypothetical protein ABII97_01480 [Patescibacteria group bacterium]